MLAKLCKRFLPTTVNEETKNSASPEEMQYALDFVNTLSTLEAALHSSDDPKEIASLTMKTACEFYGADWCGFLEIDMDLGVWTPRIWYNTNPNDETLKLLLEVELISGLPRWIKAMNDNDSIVITDTSSVCTEFPEEFAVYTRVHAKSLLAVPVKPRPVGFLVVRHPKRYEDDSRMLSMLAYVVLNAINQHTYIEGAKRALSPETIQNDKDVIINFFGNMEIYTSRGVLRDQDFKAPKAARVVTYLLLHRKATHPPLEIAAALWPEDHLDPDAISSNIRGFIFRFRHAFAIISDYPLIESTPNGYRINPELHVETDIQQFDRLWDAAQHAAGTSQKVELLKQAVDIYKGHIFENACDEHWIVSLVNHYSMRYVGLINELLSTLAAAGDYSGVQLYASRALDIMPGNLRAHYWLIFAMYHMGAIEMAKAEVERAKSDLTTEEYHTLVRYLREDKHMPIRVLFEDLRVL